MFLPRRFVCPPKEFRYLYGREMRQTSLEMFLVKDATKKSCNVKKHLPKMVQSCITKYFCSRK
jgi:hypothetical protein